MEYSKAALFCKSCSLLRYAFVEPVKQEPSYFTRAYDLCCVQAPVVVLAEERFAVTAMSINSLSYVCTILHPHERCSTRSLQPCPISERRSSAIARGPNCCGMHYRHTKSGPFPAPSSRSGTSSAAACAPASWLGLPPVSSVRSCRARAPT